MWGHFTKFESKSKYYIYTEERVAVVLWFLNTVLQLQ